MGSAGAGGVAFLLFDTGFAALLLVRGFGLLDGVAGLAELALPAAASPGLDASFLRSENEAQMWGEITSTQDLAHRTRRKQSTCCCALYVARHQHWEDSPVAHRRHAQRDGHTAGLTGVHP